MAWAQGVYFRNTDDQTDPTDYDAEIHDVQDCYPHTSAQGNNIGWEEGSFADSRDRTGATDVRLKGMTFVSNLDQVITFRIALPSAGTYNIRGAFGDGQGSSKPRIRFYDDTTEFADMSAVINAVEWMDATGVVRTSESAWVNDNAPRQRNFSSSIFKITVGAHADNNGIAPIAAIYIEALDRSTLHINAKRPRPFAPGLAR